MHLPTVRARLFAFALIQIGAASHATAQVKEPESPPDRPTQIEGITVFGVAPVLGSGIDPDKVPNETRVLRGPELTRTGTPSLLGALQDQVSSVNLNATLENPYQPDLQYRGFEASPLEGTPQGIAAYQNGVRINEAFGDTVNWDLIPDVAIRAMNLTSTNPVFGFNALGGAVAIEMKNGFTYRGGEVELSGGSFGRRTGSIEYGASFGDWAIYVAGSASNEDGWRPHSDSQTRRLFGDLGYEDGPTKLHLSFTGADNNLGGIGPTPVQLLALHRDEVWTFPDKIGDNLAFVTLTWSTALSDTLSIEGNWYYRGFRQRLVNGNPSQAQGCDPGIDPTVDPNSLCVFNATGSAESQLFDPSGRRVPLSVVGNAPAEIDMADTATSGLGGSLQATETARLFGRDNHLVVGGSFDHGDTSFLTHTLLGTFNAERGVVADLPVNSAGSIHDISLATTNAYGGLYATDTLDVTPSLSVTASGRYNLALIRLTDRLGGDLNGSHRYARFNPAAGATYKVTSSITIFADYAENNRTPTAAELSCADPAQSCSLASFFVADPALDQVVARGYEAGLRGHFSTGDSGRIQWNLELFHTDNSNDIIEVASAIPGRGFFQNAGTTRRQGLSASLIYRDGKWRVFTDYSFIDATFRSSLTLNSPNNPAADANGRIQVRPGDRMPGIPEHRLKIGADYDLTPDWTIGTTLTVASDQILRGDEANRNPPLSGYAIVKLHSEYRIGSHVQIFGTIENLFDSHYETFGTFTDVTRVPVAELPGIDNPRTVSPGPPISVFAGIRLTL